MSIDSTFLEIIITNLSILALKLKKRFHCYAQRFLQGAVTSFSLKSQEYLAHLRKEAMLKIENGFQFQIFINFFVFLFLQLVINVVLIGCEGFFFLTLGARPVERTVLQSVVTIATVTVFYFHIKNQLTIIIMDQLK